MELFSRPNPHHLFQPVSGQMENCCRKILFHADKSNERDRPIDFQCSNIRVIMPVEQQQKKNKFGKNIPNIIQERDIMSWNLQDQN